jgi:hypothetical protein
VNWHDRSPAPERLWGDFYGQLLEQLQEKNAWFATAAQTVDWFRRRRSATFEQMADGRVKVRLPAAGDEKLPSLRVRVFCPGKTAAPMSEETLYDGWETSLAA